ncbi:MAG: FecR family protein, partial [Chloroflexota bacterium]
MNDERDLQQRLRSAADRISVPNRPLRAGGHGVGRPTGNGSQSPLDFMRERMAHAPTRAISGIVMLAMVVTTILGVVAPSRAIASSSLLTIIGGEVQLSDAPGEPFRVAEDGAVLRAGMTVKAGTDGRAVLTFEDGSTMAIEPGSEIGVDEVATGTHGELLVRIQQAFGKTWSHVQPLLSPNSRFHIKTPAATAVVRGTSFEITVEIQGETTVNVFQGTVVMVAAGAEVPVAAGKQTAVQQGAPPAPPVLAKPAEVRLRLGLNSPATMVVTDPIGRSAGITPNGVVNAVPGTSTTAPEDHPQLVDISSPVAGEWEIALQPRGDG